MNLAVIATVFAIVFPAELPDKTALTSLVLATRYRASWVFAGVVAAFTLDVAVAVTTRHLLTLLPHWVVPGLGAAAANAATGVLFGRLYHRWGRAAPLVVAHTLIDAVAFVGYAALRGKVSWLPIPH